jgi:hypothetical protein
MILPTPIAIGCGFIFGFDPMFIPIAIVGTIFSSGLFLCARMLWTREFHIVATERNLEIQREGFLSNKTFFIDSQDITKVDVKDSGTKIGDDTLYCVEVKGKGGQSFTMMTGRDESELVYVARLIHQRMKIATPTGLYFQNGEELSLVQELAERFQRCLGIKIRFAKSSFSAGIHG